MAHPKKSVTQLTRKASSILRPPGKTTLAHTQATPRATILWKAHLSRETAVCQSNCTGSTTFHWRSIHRGHGKYGMSEEGMRMSLLTYSVSNQLIYQPIYHIPIKISVNQTRQISAIYSCFCLPLQSTHLLNLTNFALDISNLLSQCELNRYTWAKLKPLEI